MKPPLPLRRAVAFVMRTFPDAELITFSPDAGAILSAGAVSFRVWPDGLTAARLPDGTCVRLDADEGAIGPQIKTVTHRKRLSKE
jgi:hypothetical protein